MTPGKNRLFSFLGSACPKVRHSNLKKKCVSVTQETTNSRPPLRVAVDISRGLRSGAGAESRGTCVSSLATLSTLPERDRERSGFLGL